MKVRFPRGHTREPPDCVPEEDGNARILYICPELGERWTCSRRDEMVVFNVGCIRLGMRLG